MTTPLAQTDTTDTTQPSVEVGDPSRPLTDWLVDLFDLDPSGGTARFFDLVVEPVVQIVLIVLIALIFLRLLRRLARRLFTRAKDDTTVARWGVELPFADEDHPVSTRKRQRLDALGAVTDSMLAVVVWSIALLTILGTTFGINLAPFIAGAGILGIALGFGAQDLVKDFVSGIFMLAEDQFGVGDVVDVGEATGVVERVSLRTTRLRDVTGTVWHVPNGEIRRVGNMSQEWSRALLDIGIAYGADVGEASRLIKEVADEMAHQAPYEDLFLADPEIWGVEDLSADSILIRLVIKTLPGEQWQIARELRRRIKDAFDDADIEIPFPQRTVWLRTEDADETARDSGRGSPDDDPGHADTGAPDPDLPGNTKPQNIPDMD